MPVDVLLGHGDVRNLDGFDVTAVHLRGPVTLGAEGPHRQEWRARGW